MHRCRPRSRTDRPTLALTLLPAVTVVLAAAGVSLAMLLLLPSRGNAQAANDTADAGSDEPPARIATARLDFDADGVADTLSLVMTAGRVYEDTVEWCGRGEKYEGAFAVRIALAGGSTTERALDGYEFFRAGDSTLAFADYDGDGRLDFNLGQYASCNGWRYRLYTVEPSGRVRELPVAGHASGIPVSDFANSTRQLVPTDGGFGQCFYHTERGHLLRRYRWDADDGRFTLAEERAVERCRTRVERGQTPDSTPEGVARAVFDAVDAGDWRRAASLVHPDVSEAVKRKLIEKYRCLALDSAEVVASYLAADSSVGREEAERVAAGGERWRRRHGSLNRLEVQFPELESIEELAALPAPEVLARSWERDQTRQSQSLPGWARDAETERFRRIVGSVKEGRWVNVLYRSGWHYREGDPERTTDVERIPPYTLMLRRDGKRWKVGSLNGLIVPGAQGWGPGILSSRLRGGFCPWLGD